MLQEVRPGAKLDIPTLDEIRAHFEHHTHAIRNALIPRVKYRRILWQGNADASGNIGVVTNLEPEPGFLWDINRLAVVNNAGNQGSCSVFLNTGNPGDLVFPSVNCPGIFPIYASEQFVVQPGNSLYVAGSGLGAGSAITLTGQVKEVSINFVDSLNI